MAETATGEAQTSEAFTEHERDAIRRLNEREQQEAAAKERKRLAAAVGLADVNTGRRIGERAAELLERARGEIATAWEGPTDEQRWEKVRGEVEERVRELRGALHERAVELGLSADYLPPLKLDWPFGEHGYPVWFEGSISPFSDRGPRHGSGDTAAETRRRELSEWAERRISQLEEDARAKLAAWAREAGHAARQLDPWSAEAQGLPGSVPTAESLMPALRVKGLPSKGPRRRARRLTAYSRGGQSKGESR